MECAHALSEAFAPVGLVRFRVGAVVPLVRAGNVYLPPVYTSGSSVSMTQSIATDLGLGKPWEEPGKASVDTQIRPVVDTCNPASRRASPGVKALRWPSVTSVLGVLNWPGPRCLRLAGSKVFIEGAKRSLIRLLRK